MDLKPRPIWPSMVLNRRFRQWPVIALPRTWANHLQQAKTRLWLALFSKESCKLKSCCLARIYIRRNGSGDINIDHIATHSGHKPRALEEQRFLKLSQDVVQQIKEQAKQGIPSDRIVKNCNA